MNDTASVAHALATVREYGAWAIIRRSTRAGDRDTVGVLGGRPWVADSLTDVPLETGEPAPGRQCDRLLAVPFRQIAERGFAAQDDGAPLTVVDVEAEYEFSVAEVIDAIEPVSVDFTDRGGFETDDADYEQVVRRIIETEIGQGEGANLVIGRSYRAVIADFEARSAEIALSVYRNLLARERGAYWTFLFFTGERYLIGASPERHVSVHGGDVRMNPISGTFRVRPEPGDERPIADRLAAFLRDEKEIYELFMVVDEELKMMCDLCTDGGQVLGPFLKPMTHLIHTEYLLAGRSDRDVREILRDTMYAATVTGSPVENACRLIAAYEPSGRGYYGAALAILGRDTAGEPVLDSPIVIRTADVGLDGELTVTAGATLVRDSDPAGEVAETHAKAGGILSAFGLVDPAPAPDVPVSVVAADEEALISLHARNRRLSRFWLNDQAGSPTDPSLQGRSVVILDNEDDFVNMLRHLLAVMGIRSTVLRHEDYRPGALAGYDLVLVGPGPGDPRDGADAKIAQVRAAVDELLVGDQPFLAVCLGHQTLCQRLGLELTYKDIVFQGTQSEVELDGRRERVGFYNTFVAKAVDPLPEAAARRGVVLDADPESGDVHAIRGDGFAGIQFHAESILTEDGQRLLHDLLVDLLH